MIPVLASSEPGSVDIIHHVSNPDYYGFDIPGIGEVRLPLPHEMLLMSKFSAVMVIVAVILILLMMTYRRKMTDVPRSIIQRLLEPVVLFVRDNIVREVMGRDGDKFTPFYLTLFFFILFCNLAGLVPWGASPTGSLCVTGTLAGISLALLFVAGMVKQGPLKFWINLVPHGVPIYIWPLIFAIELVGIGTKHLALTIRLFANMLAGHAVILGIMGLMFIFGNVLIGSVLAPAVVAFVVCLFIFEIAIAFIQAYIFTYLSVIFVGMAVNPEH